jgi:outer membrane immunogenic protein
MGLGAIGGPAFAANPASVVAANWTGFYVGLNAGWARARSDVSNSTDAGGYFFPANVAGLNAAGSFGTSDDGFTGGGQIGYNWQTGIWVLGVEGDFSALITKSQNTLIIPFVTVPANGTRIDNQIETDWFATIRGRLGVVAYGSALLYATGGVAFANMKLATTTFDLVPVPNGINCTTQHCGASGGSSTKTGWTAGGGMEWAINRNWSAKGEYLFADFGSVSIDTVHNGPNVPAVPSVIHTNVDLHLHVIRAGLNYRF